MFTEGTKIRMLHSWSILDSGSIFTLGRPHQSNPKHITIKEQPGVWRHIDELYTRNGKAFEIVTESTATDLINLKLGDKLKRIKARNDGSHAEFVGKIYTVIRVWPNNKGVDLKRPDGSCGQLFIQKGGVKEQFIKMGVPDIVDHVLRDEPFQKKVDPYAAHREMLVRKGVEFGGPAFTLGGAREIKKHDMLAFERKHAIEPTDEQWGEEFES